MGAIHRLLQRMGFVKLDRYGLLLTPDGRILSSRPAVLDDGLGGRIVGWLDGDLAAMELQQWEPARPAPKQATASRVAGALAPTVPQPVRPPMPPAAKVVAPAAPAAPVKAEPRLPGVAPVAAPVAAPVPAPVVAATVPAPVAPAEEPEEDDWEWTVAMAKARAAAEETELAAAAPKFVAPAPKFVAPAPAPKAVTPAPRPAFIPAKTAPMAKVAEPKKTAPMAVQVVPPVLPEPPALPEPEEDWDALIAKASVPSAPPRTIIPVPTLPRASGAAMVRPAITPVARPSLAPLRRVPRATDRIEDTVRTTAAPANDDRTSPGIALPPSGGGRRVAAKQR